MSRCKSLLAIVFTLAGALSVATPALATPGECAGVLCDDIMVDRLYLKGSGDVAIRTSGAESALSCTAGSDYILLKQDHALFREIYTTLLTAHVAQRPVDVRVATGGQCTVLYIVSDR